MENRGEGTKKIGMTSLRINDQVPEFTCESTKGPISLYNFMDNYPNQWLLFFSHPADFSKYLLTSIVILHMSSSCVHYRVDSLCS